MDIEPGNRPRMELRPVGVVRSGIKSPMLEAGEADIELKERMEKVREYHRKVIDSVSEWSSFQNGRNCFKALRAFPISSFYTGPT
jgi:tRNA (adenine37-N6)-methyltransferase